MMNNTLLKMTVHFFFLWSFLTSHTSIGTSHRCVETDKTVSMLAHFLCDPLQIIPTLGARLLLLLAITYVLRELSDLEYRTTAFRTPNVQVVDLLGRFLVGKKVS